MTPGPSSTTVTFPRWITWLGLLILGSGLASAPVSPTVASGGLATSSTLWSSAELTSAVLGGGTSRDYTTGVEGWTKEAFVALGAFGLEWTSATEPSRRMVFDGSVMSQNLVPGGASTWETAGNIYSDPRNVVYATNAVTLSHDQARFVVRLQSLDPGVMTDKRLFWKGELPASYQPTYSSPAAGTLIIHDALHRHPSVIAQATTTAGMVDWGGDGIYSQPLVDGDLTPTLYAHSTSDMDFTVTITVGLIDYDPCSVDEATSIAGSRAGVLGTTWPSVTSCLGSPSWSITADGEASKNLVVPFDSAVGSLPEGAIRTLDLSGLPAGLTWARGDDSGSNLHMRVTAGSDVAPGVYPISLSTAKKTTLGGVETISQPATSTATLTVLAAPPTPVAEPEPTQVPNSTTNRMAPSQGGASALEVAVPDTEPSPLTTTAKSPETEDIPVPVMEIPEAEPSPWNPELRAPHDVTPADLGEQIPEPQPAGALAGISGAALATAGGLTALIRRRRMREPGIEEGF